MIKIKGLYKSYREQEVLRGLDLNIAEGELVVVIGGSGQGKSVLLKHIVGLQSPDSGSIFIDGTDITTIGARELEGVRELFGVLFQGGALFDSLTVYQNVAFPLVEKTKLKKEEVRLRVLSALEDVDLGGMGLKYPAELSGGMKKRVALARALITKPRIVLFDEPTTGLDPVTLQSIHTLITNTHNKYGYTGLIVSHEIPEIFDVAQRVVVLEGGVIIGDGTPDEIRCSTNPKVRHFITGGRDDVPGGDCV